MSNSMHHNLLLRDCSFYLTALLLLDLDIELYIYCAFYLLPRFIKQLRRLKQNY